MKRLIRFSTWLLLALWVVILIAHFPAHSVNNLDETNLLSPLDTSSPRATVAGFMQESQLAHQLVLEADRQTRRTSGLRHSAAVREKGKIAEVRMRRAMRYIDLSHIPEAQRFRKGLRTAVLLHEVLNRITLPPLTEIPDGTSNSTNRIEVFAGIVVEKITEGSRSGEHLFTQQTVKRLETIYHILNQLLPRPEERDFYRFYIATPGRLLPPKWSYWLPRWTKVLIGQQTLWQWLFLLLTILGAVGTYWLVNRLQKWDAAPANSLRKSWEGLINPTTMLILITLVSRIQKEINITGTLDELLIAFGEVFFFSTLSWFLFMFINSIGRTLIAAPIFSQKPLEAIMIRNGFRIVGVMVIVTTLYTGFKRLGYDVAPMLAGIGAGSLALSLGLQPYVKNMIGGVTLLVNGTMKIGEFCQVCGIKGVIQDIGLTATQLRTSDRSLVTLSNAAILDQQIINYSRRDRYVFSQELTLKRSFQTDIESVIVATKEILETAPYLTQGQVHLVNLTPEQVTFAITADVLTTDAGEYEAISQELLGRLQSLG